jgi:hypothetical protein
MLEMGDEQVQEGLAQIIVAFGRAVCTPCTGLWMARNGSDSLFSVFQTMLPQVLRTMISLPISRLLNGPCCVCSMHFTLESGDTANLAYQRPRSTRYFNHRLLAFVAQGQENVNSSGEKIISKTQSRIQLPISIQMISLVRNTSTNHNFQIVYGILFCMECCFLFP